MLSHKLNTKCDDNFALKLIKIYSIYEYYLIVVFLRFSFLQENGNLNWPSHFNELSANSEVPCINTQSYVWKVYKIEWSFRNWWWLCLLNFSKSHPTHLFVWDQTFHTSLKNKLNLKVGYWCILIDPESIAGSCARCYLPKLRTLHDNWQKL